MAIVLSSDIPWLGTFPSMSWLILAASIGVVATLVSYFSKFKPFLTGNALPGIPGIKSATPILGSLPAICSDGIPAIINQLVEMSGDEGIAYCWVGPTVLVTLSEPDIARQLLSQPEDVVSREGDNDLWNPFLVMRRLIGDNLFLYEGNKAKIGRSVFQSIFVSPKALDKNFDFLNNMAKKHVDRIIKKAAGDNLKLFLEEYAVDLFGEFFYDMPDTHLENDNLLSVSADITELFASASHTWRHGFRSLLTFKGSNQCDSVEQGTQKAFQRLLDKRINYSQSLETTGGKLAHGTLRQITVRTGGGNDGPYNSTAREIAALSLFGGHHSIGNTVTWALFELTRHPDVHRKLLEELHSASKTGEWTFQKLRTSTPYLDAILSEIMRLYPVVHATARIMQKPFSLTTAQGRIVTLAPRMLVYVSFYHLMRDKALWGPDALDFKPERWLEDNFRANASEYFMPFGFGPRSCIGYQIAMLAMKTYIVQLLNRHELIVDEHSRTLKWGAILESGKPMGFRVRGTSARD